MPGRAADQVGQGAENGSNGLGKNIQVQENKCLANRLNYSRTGIKDMVFLKTQA